MKPEEFEQYDGLGLAEMVGRRREVSAAEVLDAAVAAVEERRGGPPDSSLDVAGASPELTPSGVRRTADAV